MAKKQTTSTPSDKPANRYNPFRIFRTLTVLSRREGVFLIILGLLVGVGTGFGAIGFRLLIKFFNTFFFEYGSNSLHIEDGYSYLLPLLPALGGLMVGCLTYFLAREAKGHGVPEVMSSVIKQGGVIRPRVVLVKCLASAICIGSGGSVGREGPIVQIGSALGSTFAQIMKLGRNSIKIMVGCGAAAGIAATFNAPIAGVLFALEVILRDFSARTFTPIIVASISATVVSRHFLGNQPAFNVPEYALVSPWELIFYLILGIVAGVFAVFFIRLLYRTEDIFEKIPVPEYVKPVMGGLLIGAIALFLPQILGVGYETIEKATHAQLAIHLLLALVFVKIISSSLTLGSGGSGGVFAPSLFIGATLGALFGLGVNYLYPDISASPGAYAIVGMGAVVAGTTHAPLCSILILFEMTDDYRIILPIMLVTIISTLVARLIERESIYTMKLSRRGERLKFGADISVLEQIRVTEIMRKDYDSVQEDTTSAGIIKLARKSKFTNLPVVDKKGEFMGVLGIEEIHSLIGQHELAQVVIAADAAVRRDTYVTVDATLAEALTQFVSTHVDELPVLDSRRRKKLVGIIDHTDLMRRYQLEIG